MSFEIAVASFKSRYALRFPAFVTFKPCGPGKPRLHITLAKEFVVQARIEPGNYFELMVGKGNDKGRLMLIKSEHGNIRARNNRGALQLYCGHIEQLGTTTREFGHCKASIMDTGDVLITLSNREFARQAPQLKLIRAAGM
jgi:hypothetical protein